CSSDLTSSCCGRRRTSSARRPCSGACSTRCGRCSRRAAGSCTRRARSCAARTASRSTGSSRARPGPSSRRSFPRSRSCPVNPTGMASIMLASTSSRRPLRVYRARSISAGAAGRLARAADLLVVVVLLLGAAPRSIAQDIDPGRFDVRSAEATLENGVYYLNAWLELRLPPEAREALHSGVPLTIRLDVELVHDRRWWVDADVAELTWRYELDYHALTERYVVTNLNTRDRRSF